MFSGRISQRILCTGLVAKSGGKLFTFGSFVIGGLTWHCVQDDHFRVTRTANESPQFTLRTNSLIPTAYCDAEFPAPPATSLRSLLKGTKTNNSTHTQTEMQTGAGLAQPLGLKGEAGVLVAEFPGKNESHIVGPPLQIDSWVQYFLGAAQGLSRYVYETLLITVPTVAYDSLWIALRVLYIGTLFAPSLATLPVMLLAPTTPLDKFLPFPVPMTVKNYIFSPPSGTGSSVQMAGALQLLHDNKDTGSLIPTAATESLAHAHGHAHRHTLSDYWFALFKSSVRYSGPCIMKFTQWLATRPDLLPLSACLELQEIQTNSYSPSKADSVAILRADLGENILKELAVHESDLRVVGNGCVAQVLYGQTWTGEDIAVKVIHPYIARNIELDIRIMVYAATVAEALLPGVHNWSLVDSVAEFRGIMYSQLSMVDEAQRLDRFRGNFDRDRLRKISLLRNCNVVFPRPLWPYVTPNVLVESFEPGFACSDILNERGLHDTPSAPTPRQEAVSSESGTGIESLLAVPSTAEAALSGLISDKHLIAELTANTMLKMIFVDNFVHGDLHPGNILLRYAKPDMAGGTGTGSAGNESPVLEMVILDAGIVSELTGADKRNLIDLFKAIARNGGEEAGALIIERSAFNAQQLRNYYNKQGRAGGSLLEGVQGVAGSASASAPDAPSIAATATQLGDSTKISDDVHNPTPLSAPAAMPAPGPLPGPNTPGIIDPEGFCLEIKALVDEVHTHGLSLGRISIGNILERMLLLCHKHNVKMDAKFIQTMLALGIAEGVIKRLDPEINVLERAIPYIVKAAVVDSVEQRFGRVRESESESGSVPPSI